MSLRTLRDITVTFASQLLLLIAAFTIQLPAQAGGRPTVNPSGQEVTIEAHQQEKQGDVYTLDGDVEIASQTETLRADHAVYNQATGTVSASGRVTYDGSLHDAHLVAGHASYNVKSATGDFYDVSGTFGMVIKGQSVVLTTTNPFVVAGRVVHKLGPDHYVVEHGSVTSCPQQNSTWTFNSNHINVVAGKDARLYHASFRLMKLPIFYFPYLQAPAGENSRTSGFLLPSFGQSSIKGFIMGDSVYWAINRSNDVTMGAEYFSKRGWSQRFSFRTRPGENSALELHYFGVLDRGTSITQTLNGKTTVTRQDQGGQEVRLTGEDSYGHWRGVADIDYLSSFLFRQAWSESYTQAIDSEVRSAAFIAHNQQGFSVNAGMGRYQNFYLDPSNNLYSNQIKILHPPGGEVNGLEQHVGHSPFVWGVDARAGGLQRSEPGFVTANVVGRLSVRPRVALPLEWKGWELRPELAVQDTFYTQQISSSAGNPLGVASGNELNRRDLEAQVELRPPALEKTFEQQLFGARLRHVIEPIFIYRYTTGIGNFQNIIRFDQMDIVTDTSEFEYDVVQRIYGRRRSTKNDVGCEAEEAKTPAKADEHRPNKQQPVYIPGYSAGRARCETQSEQPRELLSWEVKQKYYVNERFGGALVPGRRNVFSDTADLTGIAFLDGARTWSPVVSKLRLETSANTDLQWQLDYDPVRGRVNSSATFAEYRWRQYFFGGSHVFFRVPANSVTQTVSTSTGAPLQFNQMRALAGYGNPNKPGFSGGASMGYDVERNFLQYSAVQSTYNNDCCGLSFEFRRISVPGVRTENQYRFAFTLANIGTFGNLRKRERLY